MATRAARKTKETSNNINLDTTDIKEEKHLEEPKLSRIHKAEEIEEVELEEEEDLSEDEEDIEDDTEEDEESSAPRKRGRKSKEEMSSFSITVDRKVYKVSSDRYGWTLSIRKSTPNGKEKYLFVPLLYAGSFHQIMMSLRSEAISTSSYKKLSQLISNINRINAELISFVTEIDRNIPQKHYDDMAKTLLKELKIAAE